MLDRLRLLLNRPLTDADRPRLFGLAVAVILLVALALTMLADTDAAPPATRPAAQSPKPSSPAAPPEPALAPPAPAEAPSEEGKPPDALAASRADVTEAKRAARRFLAGYLPYSYGRHGARRVTGATPQLLAELTNERPRAPAGERRRPRIVLLQTEGAGRDRAGIVALVSDGKRRYTVPLELARIRAGWQVTNVGS